MEVMLDGLLVSCCKVTVPVVLLTGIRFIEGILRVSVKQIGRDMAVKRCVIYPFRGWKACIGTR